jgi:hypothetical protein
MSHLRRPFLSPTCDHSCATYLVRPNCHDPTSTQPSTTAPLPHPASTPHRLLRRSRPKPPEGPFDHQSVTCTSARRSRRPAADHKIAGHIALTTPGLTFHLLARARRADQENEWTETIETSSRNTITPSQRRAEQGRRHDEVCDTIVVTSWHVHQFSARHGSRASIIVRAIARDGREHVKVR